MNSPDLNLKYCTYSTSHPTGFFYLGKGITANVVAGRYIGSGVRFNLSLLTPGFERNTWTTVVLNTYATEEEAYTAEEALVPIDALHNIYILNDTAGGRKGKYQTRNTLMKRINAKKRAENKKSKSDKQKAKIAALKAKLKSKG